MDKNMIKIDDLLRQRFDGAEEQERPAAWLQMRDLLDKQIPVTRAAVNWRRMFAYVAGVALLAAVSVGTYEMSDSFSDADEVAANSTTGTAAAPVTTGLAGSAINSLPDTRMEAETAAQPKLANDAANSTATTTSGSANSNKHSATSANSNRHNKSQQFVAGNSNSHKSGANSNNPQQYRTSPDGNVGKNGQFAADNDAVVKSNKPQQSATKPADANRNNAERTDKINSGSAANNGNTSAKTTPDKPGNNNTGKQGADKEDGLAKANNNKPTEQFDEKEIPISKIERVGKDGESRMDTIFNGKDVKTVQVPKDQLLAKNNTDEELTSGSNINLASAAPSAKKETSSEEAPMQKLGDHKVDSRKMKNYNPQRFEEMVKNAKYSIGSMKFYPGIVGGINASMNGNFGIQAGLAANLTIGDRWALLTEVKYAFRFNNVKENMQDDYINNVQPTYMNGQFVYKYDSMQHYYTFGNYQSLEVPLMLTYTNNRFIYMLGANFKYNLKINNLTEVEQRYLLEQSYTTTSEPKFATDKQILLTDFGNSMGISPMLGFGYQLSPGWRIDGRLSQSVWNNAGTKGQKEIYKSLHNMPQVQFNLTYRLSSNKPYKRAR